MASLTLQFSILNNNNNGDNVMNENEQQADMNSLPPPIVSEILTRIPAKTVFGCMTVSKPWLSLIDNSFFKNEHFSKSKICPLLMFDRSFVSLRDPIIMHLVEGESVSDLVPEIGSSKLNSRIEMCKGVSSPRAKINCILLRLNANATSCEGIICSAPRHGRARDHVIVLNPVTDEYVVINFVKSNNQDQVHVSVFIGLGFSRVDESFKLLRISGNKIVNESVSTQWWAEVCVVGTKEWERIEVPLEPMINFTRRVDDVIYVSGMIYWSYAGNHFICSFDFDENVFRVLPLPEMDGVAVMHDCFVAKNMHMGVLGGSLCVSLICPRDGHVELWTVDKNGGRLTWRKIYDIQTQATDMEHTGGVWTRGCYKAIKYLEGGKILLHDWRDSFLVYDPVTRSDRMFRVLDNAYLNNAAETYMNFQVIPHLPSLVPLRDALNIEGANFEVVKDSRQRSPPRGRQPAVRRSARLGKRRGRG